MRKRIMITKFIRQQIHLFTLTMFVKNIH